jgi:hypothetical protein
MVPEVAEASRRAVSQRVALTLPPGRLASRCGRPLL